jgi:hypothetical protein
MERHSNLEMVGRHAALCDGLRAGNVTGTNAPSANAQLISNPKNTNRIEAMAEIRARLS